VRLYAPLGGTGPGDDEGAVCLNVPPSLALDNKKDALPLPAKSHFLPKSPLLTSHFFTILIP
jgi:hypothetical protein